MSTTTLRRAAIGLGAILAAGAILATALPAGPDCGTWVTPNRTEERTAALVADAERLEANARALGRPDLADRAATVADGATAAQVSCTSTLGARRTVTLVLVVLGLVGPLVLTWARRSWDRGQEETDEGTDSHRPSTESTESNRPPSP